MIHVRVLVSVRCIPLSNSNYICVHALYVNAHNSDRLKAHSALYDKYADGRIGKITEFIEANYQFITRWYDVRLLAG